MPPDLTSSRERAVLEECQHAIGYRFEKPELLRAALTHTSGANTRGASNERLEFLGDSVLGLVACELLYNRFPDYQEGDLTKIKSAVVSRKTCARFSEELGLGDFLFLGRGLTSSDLPSNMLADVYESLVGAVFLDGGWEPARDLVTEQLEPEIDRVAAESVNGSAKSTLQQWAQREFGATPRYAVLDVQGPEHDRCFKVAAEFDDYRYPPAWGRNKKEAEHKAALNALAALQGEEIPYPS